MDQEVKLKLGCRIEATGWQISVERKEEFPNSVTCPKMPQQVVNCQSPISG